MIYKQLSGIYVTESHVQCTSCYKWLPGLLPGRKGIFKKEISSHETLRGLLEQIKPSRNRKIFIALPRSWFFTRRIELPDLPLDDARDAVVNTLETYSHLPLEEIYYDVLFDRIKGKGINALLYYSQKKKMDTIINQVRETGHIKSLAAILPFSHGAAAWFSGKGSNRADEKNSLVIDYQDQDTVELALYDGHTCLDSYLLDKSGGSEELPRVIEEILTRNEIASDQVRHVSDHFEKGSDLADENLGGVAIAPIFHRLQWIHVDENLPRISLFKPMWIIGPLFLLTTAIAVYMSFYINREIEQKKADLAGINQAVSEISQEIDPILEAKTALQKAAEYQSDVEDFLATNPPLYTYINDIAQIVPENTWFAHLSYKPGIISMQGIGDDVLKVVEALRDSGKYKEVNLQGSVSRTQEGKDNFRIDLILKESVEMIEGKQK